MKKFIVKTLRKWLDKLEPKRIGNRQLAYTDKNGNLWYTVPPEKLHGSRRVLMQTILDQMARGIDNPTLVKLLNEAGEKIREKNWRSAIEALSNIEARTTKVTSLNLLGQAALVCVFAEGEPDEYSVEHWQKKTRAWATDDDARFFFINLVLGQFQGLPNISTEDLRALEAVENVLMTIPSTQPNM